MQPNSPIVHRPRRLRQHPLLRDSVAETTVPKTALIMPHFVVPGTGVLAPIGAMPGISRMSVDTLVRTVEQDFKLGVRHVMLFGVPDDSGKSANGGIATDPAGLIPQAVRALKRQFGADLLVGTDVCLCGYTDHGHCGVLHGHKIDNDASLPQLAAMAVAHAQAGADIVAPSDMMDGRVAAIRHALNANGCTDTILLAYSAKYASGYYGPFREAAHSAPSHGDRQSYQMDSRNSREARREIALDVAEGADMVMVKPALAYLDIIAQARRDTHLPVACYNVSGEYAMVKAAAQNGWIDEGRVVRENLIAMRRAGADLILTYHARDALQNGWL